MTSSVPRDDVCQLLQAVGVEVRVIRAVEHRVASLTAPTFSFFDFLRTDEMGVSNCIAALLNPRGSHSQGSSYLELFLDILGCGADWRQDLGNSVVATEARASGWRRYDIEVRLPGRRAIVIENKPWAADQALQLTDYALELRKKCCEGGWRLVYLSQGAPSERSISKQDLERYQADGSLQLVGFQIIAEWLSRCAQGTRPQSVRLFIEHLEQHIRKELLGETNMAESESIKDLVMASPESLRAALLVGGTLDGVKRQLLAEGLRDPLAEALGPTFFWEDGLLDGRGRAGFGLRAAPNAGAYLRFQFEQAGWNDFFWGLYRTEPATGDGEPLEGAQTLRRDLEAEFGSGELGKAWLWYSTDLSPLAMPGGPPVQKNWRFDEATWLAMQGRAQHSGMVEHVNRVMKVVARSVARSIVDGCG